MIATLTRHLLTALVSIVTFAMMLVTTADVAGRALFNAPIRGAFEVVTFLLAILVFTSLPLVTWDDSHITVGLFDNFFPRKLKRVLKVVMSALSTIIVAGITHRMWVQGNLMAEGQHITGFLEWPIAPVAYYMSVLSGLTTIILAAVTWQKLVGHDDRSSRSPETYRDDSGVG